MQEMEGMSGSISGSGRSPTGGNGKSTPVFLSGESPWTEEPGRLQSMGSQSQTRLSMHTQVEGIEQSSNTLDTGGYRAACSVKSTVQSNASKSRENR